jgi:hypothetical protein
VQVSIDGMTWATVAPLSASEDWQSGMVDLDRFAGAVVQVRIVFDADAAGGALTVRDVRLVSSEK